jgi:hypothetical protein
MGDGLTGRVETKILTNFFIRRAEASSPYRTAKTVHGVVTLLDGTMILFDAVVEVLLPGMDNAKTKSDCHPGPWHGTNTANVPAT